MYKILFINEIVFELHLKKLPAEDTIQNLKINLTFEDQKFGCV